MIPIPFSHVCACLYKYLTQDTMLPYLSFSSYIIPLGELILRVYIELDESPVDSEERTTVALLCAHLAVARS